MQWKKMCDMDKGSNQEYQYSSINKTWYIGHIYIKESVCVFIELKLNVKGDSLHWMEAYV